MTAHTETQADMLRLEVSRELCQRDSLPWFQRMGWHLDQLQGRQALALLDLRAFRMMAEADIFAADDRAIRQDRMNHWMYNLSGAFRGDGLSDALPSVVESVQHFEIPRAYLFDTLKAIESNVYNETIRDWDGLKRYAYRRSASFCMSVAPILGASSEASVKYFSEFSVGVGVLELLQESVVWQQRQWLPLPLHWLQEARYSERQVLGGQGLKAFPELVRRLAVQAIDHLGTLPEVPEMPTSSAEVLEGWVKQSLEQLHDLYLDPRTYLG